MQIKTKVKAGVGPNGSNANQTLAGPKTRTNVKAGVGPNGTNANQTLSGPKTRTNVKAGGLYGAKLNANQTVASKRKKK